MIDAVQLWRLNDALAYARQDFYITRTRLAWAPDSAKARADRDAAAEVFTCLEIDVAIAKGELLGRL
jgi:hypothetical protein